uniref:CYSTM domain-containing protein n=1 Tax=Bursaphelenchus xylophilus TaxID=6326 RepID=A0A1I7RXL4_BURXY
MKEMEDRPPPTYEEAVTSQPQSSYPTPLISPSSQAEISDPSETQGISKDTNCNYTDSQPQCYIPQEISDIEKRKREGRQACLECCDYCSSLLLCCAIFECCKYT